MIAFRDLAPADHPSALALNNAAVPAVNALDGDTLASIAAAAHVARVAVDGAEVVGLLVAFAPGAAYRSPHYLWFDERYDDFLYVDRIVVAPARRDDGIGRRFYEDLEALARGRFARLACEVNEEPPNPGSLRFHERAGFARAGVLVSENGAKRVRLMTKPLGPS